MCLVLHTPFFKQAWTLLRRSPFHTVQKRLPWPGTWAIAADTWLQLAYFITWPFRERHFVRETVVWDSMYDYFTTEWEGLFLLTRRLLSFEVICSYLCSQWEKSSVIEENETNLQRKTHQHRRGINKKMTPSEPLDSAVPKTMNSGCLGLLLHFSVMWTSKLSFVLKLFWGGFCL